MSGTEVVTCYSIWAGRTVEHGRTLNDDLRLWSSNRNNSKDYFLNRNPRMDRSRLKVKLMSPHENKGRITDVYLSGRERVCGTEW